MLDELAGPLAPSTGADAAGTPTLMMICPGAVGVDAEPPTDAGEIGVLLTGDEEAGGGFDGAGDVTPLVEPFGGDVGPVVAAPHVHTHVGDEPLTGAVGMLAGSGYGRSSGVKMELKKPSRDGA